MWTSYGWFANQARVDRGLLRLGLALAMVTIFMAALAVAHAFTRGAPIGGPAQLWIWFGTALLDAAIVAFTSIGGSWRIHSPSHWADRFKLVVILALGESVVSIGVGVASRPLVWQVIVGAMLSIVGAITLWWMYFHRVSGGAENALTTRTGTDRVDAATVGYTYLHYLIVTGIILTATGIDLTMHAILSPETMDLFGAATLVGGVSLYQAGTAFFWRRLTGGWLVVCLAVATALLPASTRFSPAPLPAP